jgi:hypothetical protein
MGNNVFDEEVGLLRRGSIVGYDASRDVIRVKLANTPAVKGNNSLPIDIPAPHGLSYNNGLFIGTSPVIGTPVIVGQGSGGQYYFVSHLIENLDVKPTVNIDELLIRSNDETKITLDTKNNIIIGKEDNHIHIDTNNNYLTSNFFNLNIFTQAQRSVNGIVKRDLKPNTNYSQTSKLESDIYDSKLFVIGMDPSATANKLISGPDKNPPLVENRDIVYEYYYNSDINDDYIESLLYADTPIVNDFSFPNRRISRSDTLSLSLTSPNYLMETIKGTVIDIFGNILDINRFPLGIGKDTSTLRGEKGVDKKDAFIKIKELQRKSIAFHFELNARKDIINNNQIILPDINSNSDYARNRSRFFLDIDKEGQFKLNVPSSSEKGNIPLLTRYENYSTVGTEDNSNPNKLIFRDDNLDILHDSFAASKVTATNDGFDFAVIKGSIRVLNGDVDATPKDRITESAIFHGTAYHDILNTCYVHASHDFLKYQNDDQSSNLEFLNINVDNIPILSNVVSDTINISGDKANAGGRSGLLSFDGSLEVSIGANTIDRQSLWLDTQGGIVANIGRDRKNMSAALGMDGDVFVQVGGIGVSGDSRFIDINNSHRGGALDIRVINDGGRVTMIRIDNEGVKIMTPGNLQIHAGQGMYISSDKDIKIDCETLTLQGRMVLKELGGSI